MLTQEQATELGKRAVAAGWSWEPGARTTGGDRACAIFRHEALWMCGAIATKPAWGDIRPYHVPDFRDAATLGILRAQVVARVPGAVEVRPWDNYGENHTAGVIWLDGADELVGQLQLVPVGRPTWPIEALVAALESGLT